MNITAPASRLRFIASELIDEASRHPAERRAALTRAAQQCAAAAISVGNLAKIPATSLAMSAVQPTIDAADAIYHAAIDALVTATLIRTPELQQEGTAA
jgi:hypothetical protein